MGTLNTAGTCHYVCLLWSLNAMSNIPLYPRWFAKLYGKDIRYYNLAFIVVFITIRNILVNLIIIPLYTSGYYLNYGWYYNFLNAFLSLINLVFFYQILVAMRNQFFS